MERIKIFICYSIKDGHFAGRLKDCFEECVGFEVFLAHDDLSPSDDWEDEILKNLEESDIIIPLISSNFLTSGYANQEVGIGLAKSKKIIPVSIDRSNPEGFLNRIQAYKCKGILDTDILRAITILFFLILKHPNYSIYKNRAIESLIYAFTHSSTYKTTRVIIGIIFEIHKITEFDKNQIENIARAVKDNDQIYKEYYLFPKLVKFLQNTYKVHIDI